METVLTSREANQDFSRAKRASKAGPVVITERGRPALVLLRYEDYQRMIGESPSILESLSTPGTDDIEFEVPTRGREAPRNADLA